MSQALNRPTRDDSEQFAPGFEAGQSFQQALGGVNNLQLEGGAQNIQALIEQRDELEGQIQGLKERTGLSKEEKKANKGAIKDLKEALRKVNNELQKAGQNALKSGSERDIYNAHLAIDENAFGREVLSSAEYNRRVNSIVERSPTVKRAWTDVRNFIDNEVYNTTQDTPHLTRAEEIAEALETILSAGSTGVIASQINVKEAALKIYDVTKTLQIQPSFTKQFRSFLDKADLIDYEVFDKKQVKQMVLRELIENIFQPQESNECKTTQGFIDVLGTAESFTEIMYTINVNLDAGRIPYHIKNGRVLNTRMSVNEIRTLHRDMKRVVMKQADISHVRRLIDFFDEIQIDIPVISKLEEYEQNLLAGDVQVITETLQSALQKKGALQEGQEVPEKIQKIVNEKLEAVQSVVESVATRSDKSDTQYWKDMGVVMSQISDALTLAAQYEGVQGRKTRMSDTQLCRQIAKVMQGIESGDKANLSFFRRLMQGNFLYKEGSEKFEQASVFDILKRVDLAVEKYNAMGRVANASPITLFKDAVKLVSRPGSVFKTKTRKQDATAVAEAMRLVADMLGQGGQATDPISAANAMTSNGLIDSVKFLQNQIFGTEAPQNTVEPTNTPDGSNLTQLQNFGIEVSNAVGNVLGSLLGTPLQAQEFDESNMVYSPEFVEKILKQTINSIDDTSDKPIDVQAELQKTLQKINDVSDDATKIQEAFKKMIESIDDTSDKPINVRAVLAETIEKINDTSDDNTQLQEAFKKAIAQIDDTSDKPVDVKKVLQQTLNNIKDVSDDATKVQEVFKKVIAEIKDTSDKEFNLETALQRVLAEIKDVSDDDTKIQEAFKKVIAEIKDTSDKEFNVAIILEKTINSISDTSDNDLRGVLKDTLAKINDTSDKDVNVKAVLQKTIAEINDTSDEAYNVKQVLNETIAKIDDTSDIDAQEQLKKTVAGFKDVSDGEFNLTIALYKLLDTIKDTSDKPVEEQLKATIAQISDTSDKPVKEQLQETLAKINDTSDTEFDLELAIKKMLVQTKDVSDVTFEDQLKGTLAYIQDLSDRDPKDPEELKNILLNLAKNITDTSDKSFKETLETTIAQINDTSDVNIHDYSELQKAIKETIEKIQDTSDKDPSDEQKPMKVIQMVSVVKGDNIEYLPLEEAQELYPDRDFSDQLVNPEDIDEGKDQDAGNNKNEDASNGQNEPKDPIDGNNESEEPKVEAEKLRYGVEKHPGVEGKIVVVFTPLERTDDANNGDFWQVTDDKEPIVKEFNSFDEAKRDIMGRVLHLDKESIREEMLVAQKGRFTSDGTLYSDDGKAYNLGYHHIQIVSADIINDINNPSSDSNKVDESATGEVKDGNNEIPNGHLTAYAIPDPDKPGAYKFVTFEEYNNWRDTSDDTAYDNPFVEVGTTTPSPEDEKNAQRNTIEQGHGTSYDQTVAEQSTTEGGHGDSHDQKVAKRNTIEQGHGTSYDQTVAEQNTTEGGHGDSHDQKVAKRNTIEQGHGTSYDQIVAQQNTTEGGHGDSHDQKVAKRNTIEQGHGTSYDQIVAQQNTIEGGHGSSYEQTFAQQNTIEGGHGSSYEQTFAQQNTIEGGHGSSYDQLVAERNTLEGHADANILSSILAKPNGEMKNLHLNIDGGPNFGGQYMDQTYTIAELQAHVQKTNPVLAEQLQNIPSHMLVTLTVPIAADVTGGASPIAGFDPIIVGSIKSIVSMQNEVVFQSNPEDTMRSQDTMTRMAGFEIESGVDMVEAKDVANKGSLQLVERMFAAEKNGLRFEADKNDPTTFNFQLSQVNGKNAANDITFISTHPGIHFSSEDGVGKLKLDPRIEVQHIAIATATSGNGNGTSSTMTFGIVGQDPNNTERQETNLSEINTFTAKKQFGSLNLTLNQDGGTNVTQTNGSNTHASQNFKNIQGDATPFQEFTARAQQLAGNAQLVDFQTDSKFEHTPVDRKVAISANTVSLYGGGKIQLDVAGNDNNNIRVNVFNPLQGGSGGGTGNNQLN